MLVLTRSQFESIKIGDEITINVIAVSKTRVKLGIECPRNITIRRTEVELPINGPVDEGPSEAVTPQTSQKPKRAKRKRKAKPTQTERYQLPYCGIVN